MSRISQPTNVEHCKQLGMQLGIKHGGCDICMEKYKVNVSLNLTIDNNCINLKKRHCIAIGKSAEEAPELPRTSINMFAMIMSKQEMLNICRNMLRAIRSKYGKMNKERVIEEEEVKV